MILRAIRWKNLLSTGNDWISIPLDQHTTTLIVGKNGHGKSQLLDAMCFVLFGKPFRKINKAQLVNSINKKNLVVELIFDVGNITYIIKRGIKPNVFEIYKNGQLIPQTASTDDYQDILERDIISVDFKTFCQVNILGSAIYTPFMELKADQRRKVVEDLLDGQIYSKMSVIAKIQLKQVQEQVQLISGDIKVLNHQIETQQKLIDQQKSMTTVSLSQFQDQIDQIDKQQISLTDQIDEINSSIAGVDQEINDLPVPLSKAEQASYQIESEITSINSKIARTQSSQVETTCSKCGQGIEHNHNFEADKQNAIADLNQQLAKFEQRKVKINQIIEKGSQLQKSRTTFISQKDQAKYTFNSNITTRENHVNQINEIQQVTDNKQDLLQLEQFKLNLAQATTSFDQLHDDSIVLKQCIVLLADDGLKAQLVNKYIPIINKSINQYLEKMDLFVSFEIDSQFNETIKSRHRDSFSYASFSEGEKLRIDLAILFTWRHIARIKNSTSSNLLILDEVLDGSLDEAGIEDFIKILHAAVDADNTIIISHRDSIVDSFENVILATKNGNFTEYVVN